MNSSPNQSPEVPEPNRSSQPQPEDRTVSSSDSTMPTETSPPTDSEATVQPIAPVRPKRPAPPPPPPPAEAKPAAAVAVAPPQPDVAIAEADADRNQPIPPPSEPMQYRAIGLVRGQYVPSEEQFTCGNLHADDGTIIDSVLLGRVMSLVKNHLDLEQPHLWVVYPRTRKEDGNLHMQIVGVWEPENLSQESDDETAEANADADSEDVSDDASREEGSSTDDAITNEVAENAETSDSAADVVDADDSSTETAPAISDEAAEKAVVAPSTDAKEISATSDVDENYFSIRGEIVSCSPEAEEVVVKIRQSSRKNGSSKIKFFKLTLKGTLTTGRTTGYFWDLQVERVGNNLEIQESTSIALIPPKRKGKGGRKPYGKPRSGGPRRPSSGGGKFSSPRRSDSPRSHSDLPKPVRRDGKEDSNSGDSGTTS